MKNSNNKKFFVFPQLPFIMIAVTVLAIGLFIFTMVSPIVYNRTTLSIVVCSFMLVVLPIVLVIMEILLMWAQISIDENGVTKYLFGKKIKFFSWDEICEIKGLISPISYAHTSMWIVFCNRLISDEALKFNVRKKCTIPISRRTKVIEEIMKYKPSKL